MAELQLELLGIPIFAFLCGVGLLLLSLCYLKRNPCFPIFWKERDINQSQGRAKRRRKGGTSRGWRACQSEAEEARKVLSLLQSPLGQHHDTIHVRQLLCPDPACEMCNSATAEVNRLLLLEDLDDDTLSMSSLASTVSVTESSFTQSSAFAEFPAEDLIPASLPEPSPPSPSILSPNPMTHLVDFHSPSPPGHSLSPEPFPPLDAKFSADQDPQQPLAVPPLPPHDSQTPDPIIQPEATLSLNTIFSLDPTLSQDRDPLPNLSQTMNSTDSLAYHQAPLTLSVFPPPGCPLTVTQSKSVSILLKPVLENSSPDSPCGSSTCVPIVRGTDRSSPSISEISCWQAHAKNVFFPKVSHSDFQREHVSLHLPETCLWGDSATKNLEASSHSFFGLNIQALLARQIKKRTDFQMLKKQEQEEGLSSEQTWSENQEMSSSGNSLKPLHVQETTGFKTSWDIKGKPEQLRICQQLPYVKTLGENLQQKYSQLFWGLPSLHSESLVATLLVSSSSSPLESCFVLFNGICNTSVVKTWDHESPPLLHFHPLPLHNIHSQPLPQTTPQSQPPPFTQVQPQAHLKSPLPILHSSSPPQIREYGLPFHRSQNESDSHITTENQHLEWHVLQKQQESLCGVVPVFQNSQEAICPQAPNPCLVTPSSHAYVPVSILPGHFHITSELQEKLELHNPRRLIPNWCLHTCRNLESLVLMEPQCKFTETSHQKGRHAHFHLSELQGQSSEDLAETELSLPGSFHGRIPTNIQLGKDMKRNLGYILEKSPEDSPQRISEYYLVKHLRAASEIKSNCVCHSSSHSGDEYLNISRKDIDENEMKTILRLHLSKKFWQISVGRIPLGVCRSWLAEDNRPPLSGSSQTHMESTNSKNTIVGGDCHQVTSLELSFLDPNTLQELETHIIRFRVSQRWGLPLKVLESIKSYKLREAKTWPLPEFDLLSSATHISGVDSKPEVSKPLEGCSKSFQGNKVRTNSVPVLDWLLPATSSVGNEGQGALKSSHSDIDHEVAEDVQAIESGGQTSEPHPHSSIGNVSPSETVLDKRCSPEVPTRQAGAGHGPRHENVSSSDREEMIQGQRMEKKLEHFSMSTMNFREIFKAEELCARKSQSCGIWTTSELRSSQMVNVNTSKVETTLTTECPSPKISVPQDCKLSDIEKQLLGEFKFQLKSREHSQDQGCSTDMSLTLDRLPSYSSLIQSHRVSSGDMGASQVLHVHVEDNGDWQEPCVSKRVLRKCRDTNFPPAAKRMRPLGSKAGKCQSEDSGVGASKVKNKSHPAEERELEGTSPSLSQNEQFPPESYFRKKMRQFFQWIDSKRKITGRESPQEKPKFMSTLAQHQDSAEGAALFASCGHPEAHELMTAIGKILEEKLARRHEPEDSEFSQQKEELQAQVQPDKGHPSNYGALSDPQHGERASTKSCSQEAVSAYKSRLSSVRHNRDKLTHPRKVVSFKDQHLCQRQPPSQSSGGPGPHPSPTCIHQVYQVPPATLTPD